MRGRPWSWITGRPRLTDWLVVAITLGIGGLSLVGSHYPAEVLALMLALIAIQAAALWWRRTRPVAVLLVSVLVSLVAFAITPEREPGTPALIFAVYAVSVYGPSRVRPWVAIASIALLIGAVALLLLSDVQTARKLLPAGATSLVTWVIGDYVRSRRQSFRAMITQHQQERAQAAEDERLRIARELHDVVAHNVSLMAIQAGAARVSGNSSREALESIEQSARDTLAELNRLLGVLRKDDHAPELAPQPTLDHLDVLLQPAHLAGLDVALKVTGDRRPLPPAVELSAYRIVQEAITNVLKHANANRVEVTIDYEPAALSLAVSDNGDGPQKSSNGTGHGLIGMRERVELFGGDLSTGTSALGGFTVRATLPVKA